ncbi:MAG: TRAP transporter substrate-binding protein [Paracoccaceae bacterium]
MKLTGLKATSIAMAVAFVGVTSVAEAQTTLKLSYNQPATSAAWLEVIEPYAARLETLSDGKLTVARYPGEVLHPVADGFRAAATGITDVTSAWPLYQASSFALFHGLQLPGSMPSSDIATVRVMDELYAKYLRDEYERMQVKLAFNASTPSYDILSSKPISGLDDLRGLRIRAGGSTATAIVERLGGIPVTMSITDAYTAFQQGVVDGIILASADMVAYRMYEVGKHYYQIGVARIAIPHAINAEFLAGLAPDVQAVVAEAGNEAGYDYARMYMGLTEKAIERMSQEGVTIVKASAEDQARIAELLTPMWEEFVAQNGGDGSTAASFVADMRTLREKYAAMSDADILALPPVEGLR